VVRIWEGSDQSPIAETVEGVLAFIADLRWLPGP
jgi:hypothetical protein